MFRRTNTNPDPLDILFVLCGVATVVILTFSLLLYAKDAYAADNATLVQRVTAKAGPASLTAPTIVIDSAYGGDDNGNMTVLYECDEDGDDWSSLVDSATDGPLLTSPLQQIFSGLDNDQTYQIRVTFTDTDGGSGSIIITGVKTYNPLIHNAVSTGSEEKKWPGGWGIPGGEYGEFGCQTCHEKRSGNIKRIKKNLIVTDGASSDQFPIQADPTPPATGVDFKDARDNSSDFGDDSSRSDNSQSDKVCEACHSQNTYHNYNLANNSRNNHKNNSDCTRCHQHNQGFRGGGCNGCHGGGPGGNDANIWPDSSDEGVDNGDNENDSGEHQVHIAALARSLYTYNIAQLLSDGQTLDKQKNICSYCHAVNDDDHGSGDDAEVFKATVGGTADTVVAKPVWWADAGDDDSNASYDPVAATCALVDCHNSKTTQDDVYDWYAEGSNDCLICHTEDSSNAAADIDPTSGLHTKIGTENVVVHDGSFSPSNSGTCTSCHMGIPSTSHIDGNPDDPSSLTFNFYNSANHPTLGTFEIKLGIADDDTDDTCAADCHSDKGEWYRLWSKDAFDDPTVDITQPLPDNCKVCHGQFGAWAEGTSHSGMNGGTASNMGATHNSQLPGTNPGAACEDCHVFPSRDDLHENDKITLNDDDETEALAPGDAVDAVYDGTDDVVYCSPCHNTNDLPPALDSRAFPNSTAFTTIERINGAHIPEGACYSGASGCHGDTSQRWWPSGDPEADDYPNAVSPYDSADPTPRSNGALNYGYPNRIGAHIQHNITIGELICETRQSLPRGGCSISDGNSANDPTDEDYNNTCGFCHPMTNKNGTLQATNHVDGVVDLYGGSVFPGADMMGIVSSGDPANDSWTQYDDGADGDGYIYQLDDPSSPGTVYPLDTDGAYRQYLYEYRADSTVNHGTCSQIACHSNTPFTPNWYGDEQAPGTITDLAAYTNNQDATEHNLYGDEPGTIHLYWTAPGDNGNLTGTAYEYEVYYSSAGPITDTNVDSAARAGGATTILRQGEQQEMVVDGLTPGTPYWFAVRTKDQPRYRDTDRDKIYETFVADGNVSPVASVGPTTAHVDDVAPVFWGVNLVESHDTSGAVNLKWESARDHTLPITYLVYWSRYSLKTHLANGGEMPLPTSYTGGIETFGYEDNGLGNAPGEGGSDYTISVSSTSALAYQVTNLESGVLYNFLARAKDDDDNVDDNTVVSMALPSTLPQESTETLLYLLNSSGNSLTFQPDPTAPDWSVTDGSTNGNIKFVSSQIDDDAHGASLARSYWVNGISLDLYVVNSDRRNPESFTVEFGYNDTNVLGTVDVGVGRRAQRLMKIGLSNFMGEVPANGTLYVDITNTSGDLTLSWGNTDDKGQLMVTAQPVNHQPEAPVIGSLNRATGGYVDITWSPSDDNENITQTMHYDIYGSADGSTWPYVIGTGLTDADAVEGVTWDTVGDGLDHFHSGSYPNAKIKIQASDGYLFETLNNDGTGGDDPGSGYWFSHISSEKAIPLDNSQDDEPPAAVTISHEEPRPKQGAVYLHWLAVGNDGYNHGTRASYYDIRYRKTADGALSAGTWNDAYTIEAEGEPVPAFAGIAEEFELLNMTPDTSYQTAIVTCDSGEDAVSGNTDDNCSGLSNIYEIMSGQYYCGICHSTPPDEPDTKGTHRQHGYTLEDCAKCHGDGTNPDGNNVITYDGRHYDGVINIGWAKDSSGDHLTLVELDPADNNNVSITQGSVTIYNDPDGSGGYNSGGPYTGTENTDSGRCSNFISANANGCHGPFSPQWAPDTDNSTPKDPACSDCHGSGVDVNPVAEDGDASTPYRGLDPYGRVWDCNVNGAPSELVKASPPQANHGGMDTDDRYVGAHEKHLNASFRFAKGDSCRLCHKDTMDLGLHADGNVDVLFDAIADQDDNTPATVDQTWGLSPFATPNVNTNGASCGSLNNMYCHDTDANWAEPGAKCEDCHGMAGKTYNVGGTSAADSEIGHVWDGGKVRECIHCHVAGHPQSPDGINSGDTDALLLNNNATIGINYRSGGVHLRQYSGNPNDPNGAVAYRTTMNDGSAIDTLAETCWGCHEDNGISEWETNSSASTGNSNYNFGTLNQVQWTGAIWSSGYGQNPGDPFYYKRGYIQSTHTTNPTGKSEVTWDSDNGRYNEVADPIEKIRCSNCHDVHDSNLAPGDTMTGRPYLRGTWKANPYEEDGAPFTTTTYTEDDGPSINYGFGAVPRGGTRYSELGGYYIDQNNVVPGTGDDSPTLTRAPYPTSGWTLQSSAGLCVICHTDNVDTMDEKQGENLWLGTNGHSNSALGGRFTYAENIFDYGHGRPTAISDDFGGKGKPDGGELTSLVPDMAFVSQGEIASAGGGYRSDPGYSSRYKPYTTWTITVGGGTTFYVPVAYNGYDWGATVDGGTTDRMYHQFSCSKCHNPHASRLPKLMITNCLDIRHNTWDDSQATPFLQTLFTHTNLDKVDRGMPAAYYAAAQNCHRFDPARTGSERGGWNKVTPWVKSNLDDSEHKGSNDPAYGTSNPTTPWRHSDFPTESTGW